MSFCNAKERGHVYILIFLMLIGASLEVVGIGIMVPFLGFLGNPEKVHDSVILEKIYLLTDVSNELQFLVLLSFVILIFYVLKNAYLLFLVYIQARFIYNKHASLSRNLLDMYLHKPYFFHLQRDSAVLLQNIRSEAGNVTKGVLLQYLAFLTEAVVFIFIVGFLLYLETSVALITLTVFSVLGIVVVKTLGSITTRFGMRRRKYEGVMIKWIQQSLGATKEIKIHGLQKYFVDKLFENASQFVYTSRIYTMLNAAPRMVMEVLAIGMLIMLIILAIYTGNTGEKTVSVLLLFAVASARLLPSMNRMIANINGLRFYLPALNDLKHDLHDAVNKVDRKESVKNARFNHSICLDGISYAYPDTENLALNNVSLQINKGRAVAIVGRSGSGKSTLMDLLLGLHDVQQGRITVDDIPMNEIKNIWQSKIGYVPQSIFLLEGTIRDNIAFGIDEDKVDDNKVTSAILEAQLQDFIESQSEGILTQVGENGIRLSGGERQRIGIARALYNQPEVLVFDEATASLDNETEKKITHLIYELKGKRTVILIAHRFGALQGCDDIFVLDKGVLVESGCRTKLLEQKGSFFKMYQPETQL